MVKATLTQERSEAMAIRPIPPPFPEVPEIRVEARSEVPSSLRRTVQRRMALRRVRRVSFAVAGGAMTLGAAWFTAGLIVDRPTIVARAPVANTKVAMPGVRQIPLDGTPVGSIAPPSATAEAARAAFPAVERSPEYTGFKVTAGR